MRNVYFALTLALISVASNSYAVDPALVDNTSWSVGVLNDSTMAGNTPHPAPWVFQKDGTVSAAGYWVGVWASWPGSDKLKVTIITQAGTTDTFEVTFLTSKWFVATQGNRLYRHGKRR